MNNQLDPQDPQPQIPSQTSGIPTHQDMKTGIGMLPIEVSQQSLGQLTRQPQQEDHLSMEQEGTWKQEKMPQDSSTSLKTTDLSSLNQSQSLDGILLESTQSGDNPKQELKELTTSKEKDYLPNFEGPLQSESLTPLLQPNELKKSLENSSLLIGDQPQGHHSDLISMQSQEQMQKELSESGTSQGTTSTSKGKKVKQLLSPRQEMLLKEKKELTRKLNAVKRELSAEGYRESVSVHRTKGKGSRFELHMVNLLKELGPEFAFAKTARAGSRVLDNCGIDIIDIPVIIQSKAGKQTGIKPADLIKYIDDRMKELLPPSSEWHSKIRAVVHFDDAGTGITRSEYHDIAYLTVSDLLKLFKMAFVKGE